MVGDREENSAYINLKMRQQKQLTIIGLSMCIPHLYLHIGPIADHHLSYFIMECFFDHMVGVVQSMVVMGTVWGLVYDCMKAVEPADLSPIANRFI